MIGELYEHALDGHARPEIEHADGSTTPLPVDSWLRPRPGDASLVDRCAGPTLDVGSGSGRLTVALAERGIPVLGIDVTPYAVRLSRAAGVLTLARDVFGRVPGAGRWMTVLLADGNIGIGGDPVALLCRVSELLTPLGQALVETQPPGTALRREQIRLRHDGQASAWFPWAYVGADQITEIAEQAGLAVGDTWSAGGRWFTMLRPAQRGKDGYPRADGSPTFGSLPRAYRDGDIPPRRPAGTVNGVMSFQDQYPSYQDSHAGNESGDSERERYQGFAVAGAHRQRAPWEDPLQQDAWDTGTPVPAWNAGARRARGVRQSGAQPSIWDTAAQRALRESGPQPAARDTGARTGRELPRRTSGAFRAIPDDDHGRPRHGAAASRKGRGLGLLGGIAGLLAAAVALGVANLTAAFVRPQASPVIAVGGAFIDRTPPALKNFAVEKFGENDKTMLLLGMYATVALIAIVIGMLAWRRLWIGVAGIGLFGLFGAFVAITRPEGRASDVIPSLIGGLAGIVAIVLLVRGGRRVTGRPDHPR